MKQDFINLTDKTLTFKCNHCGNITKIKPNEASICKVCGKSFDTDICQNLDVGIQSEEYYMYKLKTSIINADEATFNEAMDDLASIDSKNEIYLHLRKRKAIKNIEDKKNLDFIVEYLILQNASLSKEEKIKRIKQSPFKDEYLNELNSKEDQELVNNLFDIEPDMLVFEKKTKVINRIGLLMMIFAVVSFLFLLIFSPFVFNEEILIPTIIVISIIPAVFTAIAIINFVNEAFRIQNTITSWECQ